MFSLSVDEKGNQLVITFKDYFDLKQSEQFYAHVQKIVPKLKKGFSVLTDLSYLERMEISAKFFIEEVMDLLNQHGVSMVIRIIPDKKKDIGFSIMSLFHYSVEVPIHTYKSYPEAARLNKFLK